MTEAWTHEYAFPIPAPADRLFAALTDASELRAWFAEHAEVDPKVGGAYRFWGRHTVGTPAAAEATGTVTALDPDRQLGFAWTVYGVPGVVTFTLTPEETETGPATKVAIRHELDGPIDQPRPKELIDDWWRLTLGNLMSHTTDHGEVTRPDFADPNPEVRVSITVDAPPDRVFRALTEPAALNQWLAKDAAVEARVGGKFDLGWAEADVDHAGPAMEIIELVPNETLTISWPDWRGDASVPVQSVTWSLEREGKGTRVTLVHTGFVRAVDVSDFPFGWGHFLSELAKVAQAL